MIFIPILIIVGIFEGFSDIESEMPGSEHNSYYDEYEEELYEMEQEIETYLPEDELRKLEDDDYYYDDFE